ncbi:MAG: hypothetical protein ABID61_00075 [Candidatus Micrarchaeota archaeon]
MGTVSKVMIAAAAIGALYYGNQQMKTRFSAEEVFRRAKPKIEMLMRSDQTTSGNMVDALKRDLLDARDDTERCKVGLLAEATAHTKGDVAVAEKMIDRRSLVPYAECEPDQRESNSPDKWWKYGGFVGLLYAGISLVTSLVGILRGKAAARQAQMAERRERLRRREEDDVPRSRYEDDNPRRDPDEDDGSSRRDYDDEGPPRTDPDLD